jgi:hypothetical protein
MHLFCYLKIFSGHNCITIATRVVGPAKSSIASRPGMAARRGVLDAPANLLPAAGTPSQSPVHDRDLPAEQIAPVSGDAGLGDPPHCSANLVVNETRETQMSSELTRKVQAKFWSASILDTYTLFCGIFLVLAPWLFGFIRSAGRLDASRSASSSAS